MSKKLAILLVAIGVLKLSWGYIYAATPDSSEKDKFSGILGKFPSGFLFLAIAVAVYFFALRRK